MNPELARAEFLALMRELETEPEHVLHVADLALRLYDGLAPLHTLGADERLTLEAAACLHDIGWSVAHEGERHHKVSARLIRKRQWSGFDPREVELVALVARYHRKALPSSEHVDFHALPLADQQRVEVLSACLRVADALDRGHRQRVRLHRVEIADDRIRLLADVPEPVDLEVAAVRKKGDLARKVFPRVWSIVWLSIGVEESLHPPGP
jgi:exopolyphosphatase/guanosine-5'-triphosphate,3'-diphosphate pyrophosphatase